MPHEHGTRRNSNLPPGEKPPPPSPKPPTKPTVAQLAEKVAAQAAQIQLLLKDKESYEMRLRKLEGRITQNDSYRYIQARVNDLLSKRLEDLEQYTRRYSVVVSGLDRKRDETHESLKMEVEKILEQAGSTTSMQDVDKFHRNGPRKGSDQELIIRFKSHSAKEVLYKNRKIVQDKKKEDQKYFKIKPSLCPKRKATLLQAQNIVETFKNPPPTHPNSMQKKPNPPEFVFADVHGNLLVKMSERTEKGLFFKFKTTQELNEILYEQNMSGFDDVFDKSLTKLPPLPGAVSNIGGSVDDDSEAPMEKILEVIEARQSLSPGMVNDASIADVQVFEDA